MASRTARFSDAPPLEDPGVDGDLPGLTVRGQAAVGGEEDGGLVAPERRLGGEDGQEQGSDGQPA